MNPKTDTCGSDPSFTPRAHRGQLLTVFRPHTQHSAFPPPLWGELTWKSEGSSYIITLERKYCVFCNYSNTSIWMCTTANRSRENILSYQWNYFFAFKTKPPGHSADCLWPFRDDLPKKTAIPGATTLMCLQWGFLQKKPCPPAPESTCPHRVVGATLLPSLCPRQGAHMPFFLSELFEYIPARSPSGSHQAGSQPGKYRRRKRSRFRPWS